MSDWSVLGLSGDPTPGDPAAVSALATRMTQEADLMRTDGGKLQRVVAGEPQLRMEGDYTAKYHQALTRLPAQVASLERTYRACSAVLNRFAAALTQAQKNSRTALTVAVSAQNDLQQATADIAWYAANPPALPVLVDPRLGEATRRRDAALQDLAQARSLVQLAQSDWAAAVAECVKGILASLDGNGITPFYAPALPTAQVDSSGLSLSIPSWLRSTITVGGRTLATLGEVLDYPGVVESRLASRASGKTVGSSVGASAAVFDSFDGSASLVSAPDGSHGLELTGGYSEGLSFGLTGLVGLTGSNANTLGDLNGPFQTAAVGGGAGIFGASGSWAGANGIAQGTVGWAPGVGEKLQNPIPASGGVGGSWTLTFKSYLP